MVPEYKQSVYGKVFYQDISRCLKEMGREKEKEIITYANELSKKINIKGIGAIGILELELKLRQRGYIE